MPKHKAASTSKVAQPAKPKSPEQLAVQVISQVTWLLKGHLKNFQLAYLRIAELLVRVRDQQLYLAWKFKKIEDYGKKKLGLKRGKLFQYLKIYDWVKAEHPQWLEPKPKGYIPDLTDAADLYWIEKQLRRKGTQAKRKAALEELRAKALDGRLEAGDLKAFRGTKQRSRTQVVALMLSKLRATRRLATQTSDLPPEVVPALESAISALTQHKPVVVAALKALNTWA